MSEEKRPKLRLSRDLQPNEEATNASTDTPSSTPQSKPLETSPPKVENIQKIEASQESIPPKKVEPSETSEQKPKLKVANVNLPANDTEKFPKPSPKVDPTKESATTSEAPPPLPPTSATAPDEAKKAKKAESNIVVSIVIIAALFLILGLIVISIFLILRTSPEEAREASPEGIIQKDDTASTPEPTEPELVAPEPTETPTKSINPIDRAKEAIATVPTMEEIPDILDNSPSSGNLDSEPKREEVDEPKAVVAAKSTPIVLAEELPAVLAPSPPTALQEEVTEYLSSIHIDGVRTGSKPKIMIDAVSYNIGKIVDEATGLSFEGIKDGKLLFKDNNGILYLKSF